MRVYSVHIKRYDWVVRVYIRDKTGVYRHEVEELLDALASFGASEKDLERAEKNLSSMLMDGGLTYSSGMRRMSVMVLGKTSSAKEFLNSLVHEVMHASVHIARAMGLDLEGEEMCYVAGDLARELYDGCREYLCCGCNGEGR